MNLPVLSNQPSPLDLRSRIAGTVIEDCGSEHEAQIRKRMTTAEMFLLVRGGAHPDPDSYLCSKRADCANCAHRGTDFKADPFRTEIGYLIDAGILDREWMIFVLELAHIMERYDHNVAWGLDAGFDPTSQERRTYQQPIIHCLTRIQEELMRVIDLYQDQGATGWKPVGCTLEYPILGDPPWKTRNVVIVQRTFSLTAMWKWFTHLVLWQPRSSVPWRK